MNVESSLFCELTAEQLEAVLGAALDTQVVQARLLSGGLFNTTYFIQTVTRGDVVLRVGPINRHLLLPYEHRLMEIEAQVYRICASHGIEASELLALDTGKTVIDRDYMIVRYLPSQNLYEFRDEAHLPRIMQELGDAVARMNAVTAPRFGRIDTVTSGGGFARWSEFLLSEVDEWIPLAQRAALLTCTECERLRSTFSGHAPLFDEITTPCLTHTDLGPGNLLVRTDGERPRFGAIIDPDRAFFGDPMFEFCQITWMLTDDFLRGYGGALPSDEASVRRRKLYRALRLCWDAYVWEMEYNKHEYMLSSIKIVRQIMDECDRPIKP